MKISKLRHVIALVIFVVLAIGIIAGLPFGTLSAFGWETVSILCPIGALTTMIAAHTVIPRAVISVVLMIVGIFLVGRFYCGYMCPVPLLNKARGFFRSPKKRRELREKRDAEIREIAEYDLGLKHDCRACPAAGSCGHGNPRAKKFDSRHIILIGAILSTFVFGFPVFCVVCPIGLIFGLVTLIFRMFAFGDVTASILIVIALLIVEVFALRHWCRNICPIAGFMTLFSRFSKTTKPEIDNSKCIETTTGKPCSRCATVCDMDINLRHLDLGAHDLSDCTRCHACVEVCPTHAIKMPLVNKWDLGSNGKFRTDGAVFGDEGAAGHAPDAVAGEGAK